MNGERGERGETGATGGQGEKGDRGDAGNQGNQGFQGRVAQRGPTGAQGTTGRAGADAVLIGKRALTVIAVALVIFVGGVGTVLSVMALDNRASIDHIQDLRQLRLADVARTDVLVCQENNRQDAIITAILRASVKTRELDAARPALTRKERELVQKSFDQLVQQNCRNLPSSRPFRR